VEPDEDGLLVQPGKAVYKTGEEMVLSILSTKPESTVYIDIVKNQQTVVTRSLKVTGGKGTFRMDLPPDLFGILEVHAYQIRKSLSLIRDAKRIFVNRADDLTIDITLDKKQYLPAEKAVLDFEVKDAAGHPVLAALGLYIVDEAVFALSELQPGLEKVFFLLEKEIMKPRYQIRGVTSNILLGAFPTEPVNVERRQRAGRVLFSAVKVPGRFSVVKSSREEEMQRLIQEVHKKIWTALKTYGKEKKSWLGRDLDPLVREGYLKADDLLDPWGRPFVRMGCTCQTCRARTLTLMSFGPNGKKGGRDDIFIDAKGRVWDQKKGRRGGRRPLADGGPVPVPAGAPAGPPRAKGMPVPQPTPTPTATPTPTPAEPAMSGAGKKATPAVRIREFFPETLFVMPELITDENGKARQEVNLADSITTWRLSAFASSTAGALGSTTKPIRVFQDFFVDIDFPVSLTQNDEVSVPIAVYNYLQKPQKVKLVAERSPWFEFLGEAEKEVELAPNQVTAVYFPLKVREIGRRKFTVTARGTEMSDAIRREVEVVPDGKKFETVINGRLLKKIEHDIAIPPDSIEDSHKILLKFYPGVVCQLMEGMEGLLRMPHG
jgi:hypothetical protein